MQWWYLCLFKPFWGGEGEGTDEDGGGGVLK